jgi:Tfp pilus assembly PilM family ATPase
VEESRKRFRQRNAELMRLGKQLLSKEAYEVAPTEEVVVRDGMVKHKKEIGELLTHLHAQTRTSINAQSISVPSPASEVHDHQRRNSN